MPELPEIEAYRHALGALLAGETMIDIRVRSVSVLKTVEPAPGAVDGKAVCGVRRIGKRLAIALETELWVVIHLMLAGRLQWRAPGAPIPRKHGLAAFDFAGGTLLLTESGTQHRASLWIVRGEEALSRLDPGGIEIEASTLGQFTAALLREGHTLKRALTDPRAFAGIGHTYSDEILHRARLSPLRRNMSLDEAEIERLWLAARSVLEEWCTICQAESKGGMPKEVRSGHEAMAVHGRFGQPCPVCGAPVQRIVYAERETNYCPGCQTGGRILADRALSRLLKDEFPRSLEDLDR